MEPSAVSGWSGFGLAGGLPQVLDCLPRVKQSSAALGPASWEGPPSAYEQGVPLESPQWIAPRHTVISDALVRGLIKSSGGTYAQLGPFKPYGHGVST